MYRVGMVVCHLVPNWYQSHPLYLWTTMFDIHCFLDSCNTTYLMTLFRSLLTAVGAEAAGGAGAVGGGGGGDDDEAAAAVVVVVVVVAEDELFLDGGVYIEEELWV